MIIETDNVHYFDIVRLELSDLDTGNTLNDNVLSTIKNNLPDNDVDIKIVLPSGMNYYMLTESGISNILDGRNLAARLFLANFKDSIHIGDGGEGEYSFYRCTMTDDRIESTIRSYQSDIGGYWKYIYINPYSNYTSNIYLDAYTQCIITNGPYYYNGIFNLNELTITNISNERYFKIPFTNFSMMIDQSFKLCGNYIQFHMTKYINSTTNLWESTQVFQI